MESLSEILNEPAKKQLVVTDCVGLIDSEVKSKGGLSGAAIKTAYAIVKAVKPGMIPETVDALIGEFVEEVDPYYKAFKADSGSESLESYLGNKRSEVAESLLAVTDKRAQKTKNKTILKAYNKLRPKGKAHVEQAVPGVGRILSRHI